MSKDALVAVGANITKLDGVADVVLCASSHLFDLLGGQVVAMLVATARNIAMADEVKSVARRRRLATHRLGRVDDGQIPRRNGCAGRKCLTGMERVCQSA